MIATLDTDERQRNSDAEERAANLLKRLPDLLAWEAEQTRDDDATGRAFIIEFAGMPKAGKSSAIETMRHFFSHGTKLLVDTPTHDAKRLSGGFRVQTPAEGVSLRTPSQLKPDLFQFNTWAGAYALQELLQARHDLYHDIVILDRGPWDAGCWLEYVSGIVDPAIDPRPVREFFHLPHWAVLSDLHVVLTIEPALAARREREQRLIKHQGVASNTKLMETMKRIYEQRYEELCNQKIDHCPHVGSDAAVRIDVSELTHKETAVRIIEATMKVITCKYHYRKGETQLTPQDVLDLCPLPLTELVKAERGLLHSRVHRFVRCVNGLPRIQRGEVRAELDEHTRN